MLASTKRAFPPALLSTTSRDGAELDALVDGMHVFDFARRQVSIQAIQEGVQGGEGFGCAFGFRR